MSTLNTTFIPTRLAISQSVVSLNTLFVTTPTAHLNVAYGRGQSQPPGTFEAATQTLNLANGRADVVFPVTDATYNRWWIDIPAGHSTLYVAARVFGVVLPDSSWKVVGGRLVSRAYPADSVYRAVVSLTPFV